MYNCTCISIRVPVIVQYVEGFNRLMSNLSWVQNKLLLVNDIIKKISKLNQKVNMLNDSYRKLNNQKDQESQI